MLCDDFDALCISLLVSHSEVRKEGNPGCVQVLLLLLQNKIENC